MQRIKRPLIIGITGNIGSGKTVCCRIIESKYPVFYTDELAHLALISDETKTKVIKRWGGRLIEGDEVSREMLSEIVFNDVNELSFLNSVLHPVILTKMQEIVDKSNSEILCFEVPLLFETELQDCFDYIVLISTVDEVRESRMKKKLTGIKNFPQRSKLQMKNGLKAQLADLTIENNGTLDELFAKVNSFLSIIPELERRNVRAFQSKIKRI